MRKLTVLTFVTMDGVMQAPGGPEEDPEGKFTQGGWSVGYWDKVMDSVMSEQMRHPFDLLLGRKTYEIFAAYWPTPEGRRAASRSSRLTSRKGRCLQYRTGRQQTHSARTEAPWILRALRSRV